MHSHEQYNFALQLASTGNYKWAQEILGSLLTDPELEQGDLLFNYGWCLENAFPAKREVALECYRRAGEVAADKTCRMNSRFRAGWLLMHDRAYDRAAAEFARVLELEDAEQLNSTIYEDAAFWYASCLEAGGRYRDALVWFAYLGERPGRLAPEAWLRLVYCHLQTGNLQEALAACELFQQPLPPGFKEIRYRQLQTTAGREADMLRSCLGDSFLSEGGKNS